MRQKSDALQLATFGAGCFWGVEELFRQTPGVKETAVGYMGGHTANPTYEEVCSDKSGHAEVVQVSFDPNEVAYEELLRIFWDNHNPTTRNRQGPDEGSQYRSAVFYYTPEQKKAAQASKEALGRAGKWAGREIVTEVVPATAFHRAEEYHQQYLAKRGRTNCYF